MYVYNNYYVIAIIAGLLVSGSYCSLAVNYVNCCCAHCYVDAVLDQLYGVEQVVESLEKADTFGAELEDDRASEEERESWGEGGVERERIRE